MIHLIKIRITPKIERQLGDSIWVSEKEKGTRDAIFQLTMISKRLAQINTEEETQANMKMMEEKKLYLYFVHYQKAFDRLKHDKLEKGMEKAGAPELERRLIKNLYWRQHSAVRWIDEVSRDVKVEKGRGKAWLCNITLALQPTQ